MTGAPGLERLSLNTATTKRWSLAEAVAGCVAAGVPGIGLWRDRVAEAGAERAARLVRDAGLTVTSLCRGGFFTAPDAAGRAAALEDNRRAVEEAATVGTDTLILVCGGLPEGSNDLPGARRMVVDGIAALLPHARQHGVRLAIEPLHPMFCADRAVVSTLGQALDIAEESADDDAVGVVVDAYHVWWDPQLDRQIARAGSRIASFQVCDWVLPLPADVLLGRGHVGDGRIDLPRLADAVHAAGYRGFTEVEIFNQEIWDTPGEQTLSELTARHRDFSARLSSQ
ncbi:sugar phosphate isomerase/epimerase [Streptacidiphilus sp. P02-A3a]|uniref:sugar phosphate isomerase/epimerase family protein n=1 Tax=Streptacidiphilus sp. P02-A3a TaxID=2704468 RepID=UPI0015F9A4F2|nr:sugar phosphate isomerase/epimerase [Streptacidiphilus sp. P02-A3a]QMU71359.1 sugar phosphate isomerase/epimerase [Streptacidiphilus sp. P02-A3a]